MEKQRNRSFIRVRWEVECKKRNQTKNSRLRREDEVEFSHQLSSASAPGYNINTTLVTSVFDFASNDLEQNKKNSTADLGCYAAMMLVCLTCTKLNLLEFYISTFEGYTGQKT